jgi:hypothetical protein
LQGLRNRESQGFGGRRVDNELELARLLDRQIGDFRAVQQLVDEFRGLAVTLEAIGA